jgi:site-specific recombinase XerD
MAVTFSLANRTAKVSAIRMKLSLLGTSIDKSTGISINTEDWDPKRRFIRSAVGRTSINGISRKLRQLEMDINELAIQYKYKLVPMSFEELEYRIEELIGNPRSKSAGKPKPLFSVVTIFDFMKHFYKDCTDGVRLSPKRKKLKPSSISSYKTTFNAFERFLRSKELDLKLSEFTQKYLDAFSDYLIMDLEFAMNTHCKFMMDLQQLFKYAVKLHKIPSEMLNELEFDTRREDTDSIFMPDTEIEEMSNITEFDDEEQELVRDVFLIGCYTCMRFSDYSVFDPASIVKNRMSFIQVKTGAKITIPIHPAVNTILAKYDYNLPPVPGNNKFNQIIKKVGEKMPSMHVPFTKQITYKREVVEEVKMKYEYLQTHTARRSFCSNEYLKGTDPLVIMAISGHKSHKSFMRYIKVTNEQFADKMEQIWQAREAV